eukprot:Partr_v1_DN26749_c2_g1_i1_m9019 putative Dynactin 6
MLVIDPSAVVCETATIMHDSEQTITIGKGAVVHPRCRIEALRGSITIGNDCILEEACSIVNDSGETMVIGASNVFGVRSRFEGAHMGECNLVGANAHVCKQTSIGNNCVVHATVVTDCAETILDKSARYQVNLHPRKSTDAPEFDLKLHTLHLAYLREVLPKFNRVIKS